MVCHAFLLCNLGQHDGETPHGTAEERHPGSEATLARHIPPAHPQATSKQGGRGFRHVLLIILTSGCDSSTQSGHKASLRKFDAQS